MSFATAAGRETNVELSRRHNLVSLMLLVANLRASDISFQLELFGPRRDNFGASREDPLFVAFNTVVELCFVIGGKLVFLL